jgi:transcriptional regulator with XRE-family HTH domain
MQIVRKLRKELGWTQQELADAAGLNKVTIVHIENGVANPRVKTLEKLAATLGVEVGDFFPKAQAELPLEDTQQRDSAILKALRAYFWDLRLRWKESDSKPSPAQMKDALKLLGYLTEHGAFEGPLTPREQREVSLLFNAAHNLRPLVEEFAEQDEATWLKDMIQEVFERTEKLTR